ncbi:MAG: arylsulfotransferase family protein [Anaerolineales bacterium]
MRYQRFGITLYDRERATPGFTLITPQPGQSAYLLGMQGEIVHEWRFSHRPGNYSYLLKNGNLLWAGRTKEGPPLQRGKGGLLREYDWDGNVLWEYRDDNQHHDFRRRDNGNTIYLAWEPMRPENAARVKGGVPGTEHNGVIYSDYLREVTPGGETAWEWHAQDDMEIERYPICPIVRRSEFAHANACCPLPNGDVMVSFRRLSTIIIIDRDTRKIRWEHRDDNWGMQHDCEMLSNGHITFFANGINTPDNPRSRVIEFDPETRQTVWEYQGNPPWTLFSPQVSGAQRLASGNTLICEGQWGRVFEVTPGGDIVWEYVSPYFGVGEGGARANQLFRGYRYAADSPEIRGRLGPPSV